EALAERLRGLDGIESARVRQDVAFAGGGSLPDRPLKTWVVEVTARDVGDAELARRLRTGEPAVLGRLRKGRLVLDVRTVFRRAAGRSAAPPVRPAPGPACGPCR